MAFKILFVSKTKKQNYLDDLNCNGVQSEIFIADQVDKAIAIAGREKPQVAILDFDQPNARPLDFVKELMNCSSDMTLIGLAEKSPFSITAKAMKMGVEEIVNVKEEPHRLKDMISELTQKRKVPDQKGGLHQQQKEIYDFSNIVGESLEMKRIFEIVSKVIRRKWVTVLIQGETGTGKELIARAIHYNSFDQSQSFVEINCNVLPENLLESELFGYEKGAFTDAKTQKKGLFELAEDGTLFLDEIGEITPAVQVKLLKALEQKRIRRLGGTEDIQVNTRIIAATNRNLQNAISEGGFRTDFYYRLNVLSIYLPPLRDRGNDVILLARHFLNHYKSEYESPLREFTSEAEALLKSYHWPGNARELNHTIERIVLLSDEEKITCENLKEAIDSKTPLILAEKPSDDLRIDILKEGLSLDEVEKIVIEKVLEKTNWNKRQTCQILKIARTRLDRKIVRYGLTPDRPNSTLPSGQANS